MYTKYRWFVVLACVFCLSLFCDNEAKADGNCYGDNADHGTVDCDSNYYVGPEQFVPDQGTVSVYEDSDGNRFVFLGFKWTNTASISWYGTNSYNTLEPQVNFVGQSFYSTNFDPPFEWDIGMTFPPSSVIVASSNYPYPYADALIGDASHPNITVGSAKADLFEINQSYYTRSKVNNNSESGQMTVSFQRGRWNQFPITRDLWYAPICNEGLQILGGEPAWDIAPLCVFSCCIEYDLQVNNFEVITASSPKTAPGCYDWSYQSSVSTVTNCRETNCTDNQDSDRDGLTDCDDPDCYNSPDCISDPPSDPCSSVTSGNGYYCGDNNELNNYQGDPDDIVLCQNGLMVSVDHCTLGCTLMPNGQNDQCEQGCTQICSQGEVQCNGNNVEVCAVDGCSFVFDYSCGANEACVNGSCNPVTSPAPVINSVSCTSYMRGDSATCTIFGSNFVAGGNTFIGDLSNIQIISVAPTQVIVSGDWFCTVYLGYKEVRHRNPDGQRDDKYDLLEVVMGELQITDAWQTTVHEGANNVPMGANGCNFGPNVILWAGGIQISNIHLPAEDQVLGTGTVVGSSTDSPVDICVAKYAGAPIGFDKKCWYNFINIIP